MVRFSGIYTALLLALVVSGSRPATAENPAPTPDQIRETLRRYNSGLALPAPPRPPQGAAEFNKALALQTKQAPSSADYAEAARLYQVAVDAGITPAITNLALLYLEGNGVTKDVKKGVALLKTASARNDSQADVLLARIYLIGKDLPKNEKKAETLLNRAVKAGNKNAAAMLAEYRQWKKKNDQAMREYQDVMKKLQAGQGKPQLQTAIQPSPVMLQGYDFMENRPVPLANFLVPPSLRLAPTRPLPSTAVQPIKIIPDNSQPIIPIPSPAPAPAVR